MEQHTRDDSFWNSAVASLLPSMILVDGDGGVSMGENFGEDLWKL